MELRFPCTKALILVMTLLMDTWHQADCYDPLDANGNITVTFDIHQWTPDGYMARVTIQNYYQYRHIEKPGWSLGWKWADDEVIWSMSGAVATQQGNCSGFKYRVPYSCEANPFIVDLTPNAAAENRSDNCCHGGLLAALAIDPPNSMSSFNIVVGNLGIKTARVPGNLTLLTSDQGYTCDNLIDVLPTVVTVAGGQRQEQVFRTWKSACTYSAFVAKGAPACCVSLSAFYNPQVTPCPTCACGCMDTERLCVRGQEMNLKGPDYWNPIAIQCTDHSCPVRVHWHVKSNYRDYWRVKVTVSNYNYGYNYSDWNLVVQHPGFSQPTLTYSFNSTSLPTVGKMDDAAIFWGLEYYNDELLQAGIKEPGSVTTEILVGKDPDSFTLSNGWAFPRRVYFNGYACEMPMPDSFPGLPNTGSIPPSRFLFFFFLLPSILFF